MANYRYRYLCEYCKRESIGWGTATCRNKKCENLGGVLRRTESLGPARPPGRPASTATVNARKRLARIEQALGHEPTATIRTLQDALQRVAALEAASIRLAGAVNALAGRVALLESTSKQLVARSRRRLEPAGATTT